MYGETQEVTVENAFQKTQTQRLQLTKVMIRRLSGVSRSGESICTKRGKLNIWEKNRFLGKYEVKLTPLLMAKTHNTRLNSFLLKPKSSLTSPWFKLPRLWCPSWPSVIRDFHKSDKIWVVFHQHFLDESHRWKPGHWTSDGLCGRISQAKN